MILDEFVQVLGLEIKDDGLPQFRSSITSTIGKMGALVAGTVSAAAAISSFLRAAADTNAGAKFARSIDIGFESLQRLEFAAEQMGVSAGSLQGALAGLRVASREALIGENTGFVETLGKMGVSLRDNNNELKTAKQLFLDIADAVVRDPRNLVFANQVGFGPQTEQLLLLGSAGITALGDRAQVVSEDAAASAERFAESISELERTTNAFLINQGQPLLDWANLAAKAFLDYSESPAFEDLKTNLGGLAGQIENVVRLNREFFSSLAAELPDDAFGGLTVAGLAAFAAKRHPGASLALALPLAIADLQAFRNGEDGTFAGSFVPGFVNKFDQALDPLESLLPDREVPESLLTGRFVPLRGEAPATQTNVEPFSSPITVQNDVTVNGVQNPQDVRSEIEQISQESLLQAAEALRTPVTK